MKPGVFIERDGILNRVRIELRHQVTPVRLEQFHPRVELAPLLHRLKEAGMRLFATTNQPGVARGYLPRQELDRMHAVLIESLPLEAVLVCPHDEADDCTCRKPKPGLFIEASFQYRVLLDQSFVVSDKWQDAEVARCIGSTSLLIQSPWIGNVQRDYVMPDLKRVVNKILALNAARQEAPV